MKSKWIVILFIFVVAVFYMMNVFVPFFNDDIDYMYHPTENGYERYHSMSDVLKDTYISYFYNNGRLLCSFLAILYTGVLGDTIYNIFNTISFALIILLIGYYAIPRGKETYIDSWIIICLSFFIFTPGNRTYNIYYWGAGGGTYVVSGLVTIVYLLLVRYLSEKRKVSGISYSLLVLSGAIMGLQHEMFAFALSAATFVYYLINRGKITKPLVAFYVSFVFATIFNMLSPAILSRGGNDSVEISKMVGFLIKNLFEARILYLLIITAFISFFKKVSILDYIKDNLLVVFALCFSLIPLMFTGQGGRALFGIEFFSIILWCNLIGRMCRGRQRWSKALLLVFVVFFSVVTYESYKKWNIIENVMTKYYHSSNEFQYFEAYKGTPLTDHFSIDLGNFFGNYGTRVRMLDVKKVDYGKKEAKMIKAVPSLEALKIIRESFEILNQDYKIPGDMEAYDYPELDYFLIQCDSGKLCKVYNHKIEKKIHLSFLPQLSTSTKNSHKYMFEISDDDLKYHYLLIKKSSPLLVFDSIFISNDPCPEESIRRIKGK